MVYEQPEQKKINALQYELQLFVNSILNKEKPVVTGNDGLRALRVAKIIIDKIESSKVDLNWEIFFIIAQLHLLLNSS